jgi:hypothetical protein
MVGISDFDEACAEAKKQAFDAMASKYGANWISVDQLFMEQVEDVTRQYNTRMNPRTPDAPDGPPPIVDNPYKRASQGY